MEVSDAKRLKALEEEDARLRKLLAKRKMTRYRQYDINASKQRHLGAPRLLLG
jgi:hypothetical protein